MIKQGTQVITWHCQIKQPLIQMRSEISKTSVAFAATTHSHTRQERSEGSGTCGEATTTDFPSWINSTNGSHRAKHEQVHK